MFKMKDCLAGALKLVGEAFPWQEGSQFAYTQDNHNSVLGIRELALNQGATATCVEIHSSQGMQIYMTLTFLYECPTSRSLYYMTVAGI